MTEKEFLQEGIDFKWMILLLFKKIWMVILAAVVGAVIFGGGYFCIKVLWGPAKEYAALSRYYIEFVNDKAKDYYNAYTWNDFMVSDPILEYTMALLPEDMDKQFVKEAIVAKIEADVRVLTTTVTTKDPSLTLLIAQATEQSLIHFAQEVKEIDEIRVIKEAETELVKVDLYTLRATIYGAVGGAIITFLLLMYWLIMDQSVYLPKDFEKRYFYPVLGTLMKGKQGKNAEELLENLAFICKEGQFALLAIHKQDLGPLQEICEICNQELKWKGKLSICEGYEELRSKTGIVLAIKYGNQDLPMVNHTIEQLKKQNGTIVGAVIYQADAKMMKRYYG